MNALLLLGSFVRRKSWLLAFIYCLGHDYRYDCCNPSYKYDDHAVKELEFPGASIHLPWPRIRLRFTLREVAAYLVCCPEPWRVFFGVETTKV